MKSSLPFDKFLEKLEYTEMLDSISIPADEEEEFNFDDDDAGDLDTEGGLDDLDAFGSDADPLSMDAAPDSMPIDTAMPTALPEATGGNKVLVIYAGVQNIGEAPDMCLKTSQDLCSRFESSGYECKTIKLYQLNIQPVGETEPADGMQAIYEELRDTDILLISTPVNKGNVSGLIELFFDRLNAHYQNSDLKNKIFGAILAGENETANQEKADLLSKAYNLGMLVPSWGIQYFRTGTEPTGIGAEGNVENMSSSMIELTNITSSIRQDLVDTSSPETMDFDQFATSMGQAGDDIASLPSELDTPAADVVSDTEMSDLGTDADMSTDSDLGADADLGEEPPLDIPDEEDAQVSASGGDDDVDLELDELEDEELSDEQWEKLPEGLKKSILKKFKKEGDLSKEGKEQLEKIDENKKAEKKAVPKKVEEKKESKRLKTFSDFSAQK